MHLHFILWVEKGKAEKALIPADKMKMNQVPGFDAALIN
jgi:hypothetical protein